MAPASSSAHLKEGFDLQLRPWQMNIVGLVLGVTLALGAAAPRTAFAAVSENSETATTSKGLLTSTSDEGFMLAVDLARKGVGVTQPSSEIKAQLRPVYSTNADSLIAVSQ